MAVGEVEAWKIFAAVVAGPVSTIAAAVITAAGLTLTAAMVTDVLKETMKQQAGMQKMMIERIPRPKFF